MNEKTYLELDNLIAKGIELINIQEVKEIFGMQYLSIGKITRVF